MLTKTIVRTSCIAALALLAGCGGMKLWPFGDDQSAAKAGGPKNAILYQCESGKQFHLRHADGGNTAWIIYPDREVALVKGSSTEGSTRYGNGVAVLEIKSGEASLTDGPGIAYRGCKTPTK